MNSTAPDRGSPLSFFLLLFALSVPFYLLGALVDRLLPLPMSLPVSALAVFNPLIAASILVYREGRLNGVRALLLRAIDYRGISNRLWYVPILLLYPLVMLLSYAIMRLLRLPLPEPVISALEVPALFALYFVTAVAEEAGWMGYAVDPLQKRTSALNAGVILGSVWAAWHFIPFVQASQSPGWIVWHSIATVASRVLIVWLYNNTGRSVLAAVLFHAMSNLSTALFPVRGSHYHPAVTGSILAITAAIVTFLWGPKTLARFRSGAGR